MNTKERFKRTRVAVTAAASEESELPTGWSGVIGVEGSPTGDGRMIEKNALVWDLAEGVPVRYVESDAGMHDGAVTVGRVTAIKRNSNGNLEASGPFDLESEAGREAARKVANGVQTGVSMDLDSMSIELRVAKELLDFGEDSEIDVPDPEATEPDEDGRVTVAAINADDELEVMTSARVRAVTIVAIPAFSEARIAPGTDENVEDPSGTNSSEIDDLGSDGEDGLTYVVASAIPNTPPVTWFADPSLAEPTALQITEDGHVFGHLAVWNTCHTGFAGECLQPPHTASDYSYFRTGAVLTDDGEISVGRITLDTRHARPQLSAASTISHYEDTGTAVADVTAGEDSYGIWVAGALRSTVTDEQVRSLRSSPLSGDWRRIGGTLELVAALAVNVPGFPVPRPRALTASSNEVESLVASGMLPPKTVRPDTLSEDDLRYLKRLAYREKNEERRVELLERAHSMAASLKPKKQTVVVKKR